MEDYFTLFLFALIVLFLLKFGNKEDKSIKMIYWLLVPFIIMGGILFFSQYIFTSFYELNKDLLEGFTIFSVLWLIGFGFYIHRQNKKDRLQREKELEEKRVLQLRREQLEKLVDARTQEITLQKEALEKSMIELKATQDQLIHAEKMASLGELTAGIAHEIQNPLNFVNNFSEINNELIEELKSEMQKPLRDAKIEMTLLNDISGNLTKIIHHGKRADSIVKGMLQHSRKSNGIKELVDINIIVDEYLRLAYHGLRAKDKTFNAAFKTDIDESLEKINVVPQDIGRVLLNLSTNAFHAVDAKKKQLLESPGEKKFEPNVIVSTRRILDDKKNGILIKITDNGKGIADEHLEKIFQPFFTTKPTGQGTGLGLSIGYDIVTKGHQGELKVETRVGEGSVFSVYLPYSEK